jgi:hypothetical protein
MIYRLWCVLRLFVYTLWCDSIIITYQGTTMVAFKLMHQVLIGLYLLLWQRYVAHIRFECVHLLMTNYL